MTYFRLFLIGIFFIFCNNRTTAQLNIGYNHSNIGSLVSVNYQLKKFNRFEPGLRLSLDNYVEDLHLEPVLQFQIIQKQDYVFYAGAGMWLDGFNNTLILPLGLNFVPFSNKQFQINTEVTPIFIDGMILRGSIGIKYQFASK